MATIRICNVEGCGRKHHGRGLCQMHYHATPEGRAAIAKYHATPQCRAARAKHDAKRAATPEGRAANAKRSAKYRATDAGRAVNAKYHAKYDASPAGRAVHAKYNAKHNATDAGKDHNAWSNGMYRALAANAVIGYVPRNARSVILEVFGTACLACGAPATDIDHVVPLANGGIHCLTNLQPICGRCNRAKFTSTTDYRPDAGRVIIAALLTLADTNDNLGVIQ